MGFWEIMSTYGLIISIIMMVISLIISANCKHAFNKYSKVMASNGMTGAEAAQRILSAYGVHDVTIQHISGNLTDNYNSGDKTLNLSSSTYSSTSIAAVGVAAHETGHAIQHKTGYGPLGLRHSLYPVANIGSRFGPTLAIIGLIFGAATQNQSLYGISGLLVKAGIILYAAAVLFYLVTLPVEFDASRRALVILRETGTLDSSELEGVKKVLWAAAMTYVASALTAVASLIRLVLLSRRNRRN